MQEIQAIEKCRICGNKNLVPIVSLGNQCLTGIFPKTKKEFVPSAPLELIKCNNFSEQASCGLVQLRHTYNLNRLYGKNYGYRSGLNKSMVEHLQNKAKKISAMVDLKNDDLIIDIGSNDGTLLKAYPSNKYTLVGVDPTGSKFKKYYPERIALISDFFSAETVKKGVGSKKAKIITSIAMFYDLESPLNFMKEINSILANNGIWVFEQSYFPTMLERNAYDTICHEHLAYYSLRQIKWMTDKAGLKIIDIEFNDVNGGSFSVAASKSSSPHKENNSLINSVLNREKNIGLLKIDIYKKFSHYIKKHREELRKTIQKLNKSEKVFGYGASTKGNVLLQYCNLTAEDIPCIAEVNSDKFGSYTPGTLIPIISEQEAEKENPGCYMILPWHFKSFFIEKEQDFLKRGGELLFPLPEIEIFKL